MNNKVIKYALLLLSVVEVVKGLVIIFLFLFAVANQFYCHYNKSTSLGQKGLNVCRYTFITKDLTDPLLKMYLLLLSEKKLLLSV